VALISNIVFTIIGLSFGYGLGQFHMAQMNSLQNGLIATIKYRKSSEDPDWFASHQIKFGLESYIRMREEYKTVLGRAYLGKIPVECESEYEAIKKYIASHPNHDWSIKEIKHSKAEVPVLMWPFYYYKKLFGMSEREVERKYKEELEKVLSPNKSLKAQPPAAGTSPDGAASHCIAPLGPAP
jgi:hypothetical protein